MRLTDGLPDFSDPYADLPASAFLAPMDGEREPRPGMSPGLLITLMILIAIAAAAALAALVVGGAWIVDLL